MFSVGFSVGCVQAVLGESLKKHGTWTSGGRWVWNIHSMEDNAALRVLLVVAAVQDCVDFYSRELHYED